MILSSGGSRLLSTPVAFTRPFSPFRIILLTIFQPLFFHTKFIQSNHLKPRRRRTWLIGTEIEEARVARGLASLK
jgi:hypothetical protein